MKKYLYISLAIMILALASAEKSFACSCAASTESLNKQIQNAYSDAEAVFSGEVIEIKESTADKYGFTVKLKVSKSWKGAAQKEMTISTARDSAMCGYNFEVGKTYLVYAFGKSDNLSTTNCSRTALFISKGDVKYLDKLKRKKKISA